MSLAVRGHDDMLEVEAVGMNIPLSDVCPVLCAKPYSTLNASCWASRWTCDHLRLDWTSRYSRQEPSERSASSITDLTSLQH